MIDRRRTLLLERIAEEAVSDNIDLWPALRGRLGRRRSRRPQAAAVAAIGVVRWYWAGSCRSGRLRAS
jgi:hypothetical protein